MPVKHGQGQTTSWYKLCFIPTSSDSSDDSDIESVVLSPSNPTQTSSTWQELSPPLSPPDWEPEFDLSLPPPLPPPSLFLQPQPLQRASARTFDIEVVQQDRQHQQPLSPSHVFEGDQINDCSMNGIISRVRVSETDKLSHCPICMDEFKVGGKQACRLPCNHTYCSECILRWLNSSKTCPVCRLQLNGYSFDSTTGNNGLDSEPEILPPPPPPPLVAYNGSAWDYFSPADAPSVAHNAGVETAEADYDSASDELGDPHEDGASQSAPAPPLT